MGRQPARSRIGPKTPACCLRSHPFTTLPVCRKSTESYLKQPSVLSAGEGTRDGTDRTVFVLLELWYNEGNRTRNQNVGKPEYMGG